MTYRMLPDALCIDVIESSLPLDCELRPARPHGCQRHGCRYCLLRLKRRMLSAANHNPTRRLPLAREL